MTKLELKEWITELACSLDRGDLKIDELMNEVEEVVDKNITEQLTLTDVVKSLEVFEEIVFEDWLKQHRFTKDINHYIKNNITYREWEVFNMYTMDVYNL